MDPNHVLIVHYLLTLRLGHAREAAALMKITLNVGFTCRVLALSGVAPHETAAAVALCQPLNSGQTAGTTLFLTYRPTEWCLGLLWARNVPGVVYLHEGALYRITRADKPGENGLVPEFLGPPPAPERLNVKQWYFDAYRAKFNPREQISSQKMWDSFFTVMEPLKGA